MRCEKCYWLTLKIKEEKKRNKKEKLLAMGNVVEKCMPRREKQ